MSPLWIGVGFVIGAVLWGGSALIAWVKKQLPTQPVTRVATAPPVDATKLSVSDDRLILLAYLVSVRDRLITTEGCSEAIDKILIPALMAQKTAKV